MKFDAAAVLVTLLRPALSVNVIVPVGVPEDGATQEIEKMHAPADGRVVGKDVAPLVQAICAILKGDNGGVTASRARFACPRLETVKGSVCDCPAKPRLPTE